MKLRELLSFGAIGLLAGIIKILYVGFFWGFDLITSLFVFVEMFVISIISNMIWHFISIRLKGGKHK